MLLVMKRGGGEQMGRGVYILESSGRHDEVFALEKRGGPWAAGVDAMGSWIREDGLVRN